MQQVSVSSPRNVGVRRRLYGHNPFVWQITMSCGMDPHELTQLTRSDGPRLCLISF